MAIATTQAAAGAADGTVDDAPGPLGKIYARSNNFSTNSITVDPSDDAFRQQQQQQQQQQQLPKTLKHHFVGGINTWFDQIVLAIALMAWFSVGIMAIVTSKVLNEGVDVPEAKVAIVLGGSAGAREYIQRLGRVLRKVGNRQAVLYEIIVRKTVDEARAQRRRPRQVSEPC